MTAHRLRDLEVPGSDLQSLVLVVQELLKLKYLVLG